MKKNNKGIRSDFVKESLLDYNTLANTLKENTESAVRDLLKETVLNTYAEILAEDEDKDYDVDEVEDTESQDTEADDDVAVDDNDTAVDGMDSDVDEIDDDTEVLDDTASDDDEIDDTEVDSDVDDTLDDESEWSDFDKYKVGDDEYDFSNAEDDDIVKVYKLLKDDDQVVVTKDNNKVNIKDNETGAEYIVDMGGEDEETVDTDEVEYEVESDDDSENEEDNYMDESRIFEVALNEYDSNVGYTDNYQNKDVMTSDGVDKEPGKNVNDWDKGVPHSNSKPWSGKKGDKKENQPFHGEKGKTVEECGTMGDDEMTVDEATNVGGFVQQNSTSKSHVPNSNGRSARSASKGGSRIKGTVDPRYDKKPDGDVNESIMRKANKIFDENRQLKEALKKFKSTLEEAAVTNVNLGNIIKLIMENATSADEKKEIIERFGKEATTVKESKSLYESISRELKKSSKMNIDESKEYSVDNNKINETQLYMSNDIMESLDLMHRICK